MCCPIEPRINNNMNNETSKQITKESRQKKQYFYGQADHKG